MIDASIRTALFVVTCGSATYFAGLLFTREKFHAGRFVLYLLLTGALGLATLLIWGQASGTSFMANTIFWGVIAVVVFRQRGMRILSTWAFLLTSILGGELLTYPVLLTILGPERYDSWRMFRPYWGGIIANASVMVGMLLITFALCGLRRVLPAILTKLPRGTLVYLRLALLVTVMSLSIAMSMQRIYLSSTAEVGMEVMLNYMLCALTGIVAISYLTSDIRYAQQLKKNETLEQRQAIYNGLLDNMRYFRHNLANMLYGFEGTILSGDLSEVSAYYEEIVRRCALINNENIVALQRIPRAAISTLLLRQIANAQEQKIPFYLFVQADIRWTKLSDADLCSVLGVLIDNAKEAAREAENPYVSVELRNEARALEVVVRNTFAGELEIVRMREGGPSDKDGHEGIGLASVRKLIEEKRDLYLNIRQTGQYVEAQFVMPV